MKKNRTSRRRFLQFAAGATVASSGVLGVGAARAIVPHDSVAAAQLSDSRILIEFDSQMRTRISHQPAAGTGRKVILTRWAASESLLLTDGTRLDRLCLARQSKESIDAPLGPGIRLQMIGVAGTRRSKRLWKSSSSSVIRALQSIACRTATLRRAPWRCAAGPTPQFTCRVRLRITKALPPTTHISGVTAAARMRTGATGCSRYGPASIRTTSWACRPPITAAARPSWMSGAATAGSPSAIWRLTPELVSTPGQLQQTAGVDLGSSPRTRLETIAAASRASNSAPMRPLSPRTRGDYFAVLDTYRRHHGRSRHCLAASAGGRLSSPSGAPGATSADCTVQLIEDTLPKVRDLGLRWAVIDDGWQSNVGDWKLNREQVSARRRRHAAAGPDASAPQDLKPRLWWAPLAAAPGSDLLHDHTDMLLLDKEGAAQNVSWWNSFYLCPAYAEDHRLHAWLWCASSSATGAMRD